MNMRLNQSCNKLELKSTRYELYAYTYHLMFQATEVAQNVKVTD